MKKKTILYLLGFTFILINSACTTKKDKNTVIFEEYLETLNLKIPTEKFNYILIPKNGCQGVMGKVLMEINVKLKTTQCPYLIITTNNVLTSLFIDESLERIIDPNQKLNLLNLPIYNVTIITAEHHKITKILSSSRCDENIINEINKQLDNCN